jgi:hypothetical protein
VTPDSWPHCRHEAAATAARYADEFPAVQRQATSTKEAVRTYYRLLTALNRSKSLAAFGDLGRRRGPVATATLSRVDVGFGVFRATTACGGVRTYRCGSENPKEALLRTKSYRSNPGSRRAGIDRHSLLWSTCARIDVMTKGLHR